MQDIYTRVVARCLIRWGNDQKKSRTLNNSHHLRNEPHSTLLGNDEVFTTLPEARGFSGFVR